jgi:hypothetical protein
MACTLEIALVATVFIGAHGMNHKSDLNAPNIPMSETNRALIGYETRLVILACSMVRHRRYQVRWRV